VLVGLLMVLLDCAVAMPFVLGVGFQDWGGAYGGGLRPAPPPMDWTPTIAFGVVTVLIAFSAAGFALARMPVSAFLQTVATLAMVLATIGVTGHEHDRAHPPPAPSASAPAAAPGAAVVPQRALLPLPGSALMPGSGAAGAPRALAPDTRPICAAAGGCR
jgi:hypothetical protein